MNMFENLKHDITEIPEGYKIVYRGYCEKLTYSENLKKDVLYYLEPHGKDGSSAFVSNFPNASRSHMGVYQSDRFRLVSAELVEINSKSKVIKVVDNKKVSTEKAEPTANLEGTEKPKEISNTSNSPGTTKTETKAKETEAIARTVADLPFAKELNIQDEALEPSFDAISSDLKWDVVYEAELIYRRSGFANIPLGTYYIQRIPKDSKNFNEHSCHFYEDKELTKLIGKFPLNWFANFVEVEVNEVESNNIEQSSEMDDTKETLESTERESVKEVETLAPAKESKEVVEESTTIINLFDIPIKKKGLKKNSNKEEDTQLDLFNSFF